MIQLLFGGLSNREIAQQLHLSPLVIRNYVSRLISKFSAKNRTELLSKIIALGRYRRIQLAEWYQSPPLTPRERAILELLSEGLTNQQMGQRLHLSPFTVRNYITGLLSKLRARNRTDLLARVVALRRHHHRRLLP